jgi:hypothetical protein
LNEEAIDAFRTLAINHPVEDVVRRRQLRKTDGWPEGRRFVQLYERWMCDEFPRDADIERQLKELSTETWQHGDAVDRAYVLNFLSISRSEEGAELMVEGLKSSDRRLAEAAAFHAWCDIEKGRDFGLDIREVLEDYRDRFPERGGVAWYTLCALDKDNPPPSIPRSYQRPDEPAT